METQYRELPLKDLDHQFKTSRDPIILNHIDFKDPNYTDTIIQHIYSRVGDSSFIAHCDCGAYEGNYFAGLICPQCHTVAKSDVSSGEEIEHRTWLMIPDRVPGVLHPIVYLTLSTWLSYGRQKENYIDAILNPMMKFPKELEGVITGRGHQYFYENFDSIMEYFLDHHKKTRVKRQVPFMRVFLKKFRKIAFCRHLPILANVLHTIAAADSHSNASKYADKTPQMAIEAIHGLSHLLYNPRPIKKQEVYDERLHVAYKNYISYLDTIMRYQLSKKQSLPRKHIFGSRFHWTFRSVITPIVGVHDYDELHLPWSVSVKLLSIHIQGRLIQRYDHSAHEAWLRTMRAVITYDPLIDELMKQFIAESPFKGLPILFNRPPSLKRGSIQLLYATRVKTDVSDKTIGISVLVLKDPNADQGSENVR